MYSFVLHLHGYIRSPNNSLEEQPQFVYDENGQITGYTTKIGGADTVFPFKSKLELLWTNPDIISAVGAMTVDINISEYDALYIGACHQNAVQTVNYTYIPVGKINCVSAISHDGIHIGMRKVDTSNTDKVIFSASVYGNPNEGGGLWNAYAIPYKIYGVKKGLDFN